MMDLHMEWLTQWLLDISWLLAWSSSLGCSSSHDSLGDVLHDGHMEMVACLENALLMIRSVLHLRGGNQALDNMG